MQVTVEKKEGIQCSMLIEVPAVEVDKEIAKRIGKIAKTAKVDGFRPGKVPAGVIKKRFGDQVRMEVISDVIPQKYIKAIQDEKLNAAGVEVELKQNEEGKDLTFIVNVEVFPEFDVAGFDKIVVEKPTVELGQAQVDKMIENLKKQLATWKSVERAVQKDDQVTIDFVGKINGEVFEGGNAEGAQVLIGSGQMIPGFEDGIIGLEKDKMQTISVTFPEDYGNAELAGKAAEFDITVKDVKEAELPEIDEAFVEKFGVKGGVDTFFDEIEQNMRRELKNAIQRKLKEQVFAGLVEHNEIQVPKALVQKDIQRAKEDLLKRMGPNAAKMDINQIPDNLFEKSATERVKLGLVVSRLVEQQKIEADQASIDAFIDEMASVYEDGDEVRQHINENKKELENIKAMVIENKLVDWVVEQAQVTEKSEDFFELIKSAMPQQNPF